jgi:hypothetical protein
MVIRSSHNAASTLSSAALSEEKELGVTQLALPSQLAGDKSMISTTRRVVDIMLLILWMWATA